MGCFMHGGLKGTCGASGQMLETCSTSFRAFEGRILGVEKIFVNSCSALGLPGGLYLRGHMNCE